MSTPTSERFVARAVIVFGPSEGCLFNEVQVAKTFPLSTPVGDVSAWAREQLHMVAGAGYAMLKEIVLGRDGGIVYLPRKGATR